jgi:SAM-dependent methyltransferase
VTVTTRWDDRHRGKPIAAAASALVDRVLALPLPDGPALVLASGLSAAPLAIAAGREVVAMDASQIAMSALAERAAELGLSGRLAVRVADVECETASLPVERYALVVAEKFWSAAAFDAACLVLRPGGVLAWSALHGTRDGRPTSRWVPPEGEPASRLPDDFEILHWAVTEGAHALRELVARRAGS